MVSLRSSIVGEIESTTKHYTNARTCTHTRAHTHTFMCMLAPKSVGTHADTRVHSETENQKTDVMHGTVCATECVCEQTDRPRIKVS